MNRVKTAVTDVRWGGRYGNVIVDIWHCILDCGHSHNVSRNGRWWWHPPIRLKCPKCEAKPASSGQEG
jgi:hypothetical protein